MKDLKMIKDVIMFNILNDRPRFAGLSSAEMGLYNRTLMWGENDEAFDEDVYRAVAD